MHEAQEPCARVYNKGKNPVVIFLFILYLEARFVDFYVLLSESFSYLDERIDMLTQKCFEELKSQGFEE